MDGKDDWDRGLFNFLLGAGLSELEMMEVREWFVGGDKRG